MTKEILQQALDALIESRDDVVTGLADRQRLAGIPRYDKQITFYEAQLVKHDAAIEGLKQTLAQQEQPASVDAYVGAREDAAIWKKRALEAEELNRKFIAEVNGPTYLGEPAQPAQDHYPLPDSLYPGSKDWQAGSYKERVEWLHLMYESAKQEVARLESQQEQLAQEPKCNPHPKAPHGFMRNSSHSNDRYVCECERWEPYEAGRAAGRQEAFDELDAPPTQPTLSDGEIRAVAEQVAEEMWPGSGYVGWTQEDGEFYGKFTRAIEAHCRGGVNK